MGLIGLNRIKTKLVESNRCQLDRYESSLIESNRNEWIELKRMESNRIESHRDVWQYVRIYTLMYFAIIKNKSLQALRSFLNHRNPKREDLEKNGGLLKPKGWKKIAFLRKKTNRDIKVMIMILSTLDNAEVWNFTTYLTIKNKTKLRIMRTVFTR